MTTAMIQATSGAMSPQELRRRTQESEARAMQIRRAIAVSSLVGIASMAVVSLFQMGAIRRIPDPPVRWPHFDSRKVNSSDEAWSYGMPDAPISITAHGVNMMLAAAGPADRVEDRPWIPLLAAAAAGAQAWTAAKYLFYQMPYVDRAWCPYCVTDAVAHLATFGLTLPEAGKALTALRRD